MQNLLSNPLVWVLVGLMLLGILALVGYAIFSNRQAAVEQRLGQFTSAAQPEPAAVSKPTERKSVITDQLNRAMQKRKWGEGIARELARADVKVTPAEYVALHVILFLAVTGIIGFLQQEIIIGAIFGAGSLFLPRMWLGMQQSARLTKFDSQLSDMINLCVNGLRAGYSVTQALESVGRELPPPISVEFKRVVQEMQLGIPMEQALANLTRRIPSKDLDFMVTAMNVQREVGGNLAEILDTISFTIRERVRIKGEIQTLTAQGMMTGYVISFLPFGLGGVMFLINRNYMAQMLVDPKTFEFDNWSLCGGIAIALILLLVGGGFFIVMKIVNIEV